MDLPQPIAKKASFARRHRLLLWISGVVLAVLVALTITGTILARKIEPYLRAQIVQALSDRLHARVELDSFHVSFGTLINGHWGIFAEGHGLRIWPNYKVEAARQQQFADQALPPTAGVPLIQLDEFNFRAPLRYDSGKPIVISVVRLSGLSIHVPPKSLRDQAASPKTIDQPQPTPGNPSALSRVVVERIDCDRALLILETDKPNKLPMGFAIQRLRLNHLSFNAPMDFDAQLTNPRPAGVIHTTGKFGPWQPDDPGASGVEGNYTFDHADLAVFKGIAGILNSTGQYQGTLRNIVVDGDADVPNFSIAAFNSPLPLHTHFHARVDGTDGDTWLEPVNAVLGNAHFTTSGQIVRLKTLEMEQNPSATPESVAASLFVGGHDLQLNIDIEKTPIDDFMRLTNQSQKPLLTGIVTVKAKLHIPPGKTKVEQRLTLDGKFNLDQATFTSDKIQSKVDELSLRSQGRPGDVKHVQPGDVSSQMQSDFRVANAVVTLPDLQYNVPGAVIRVQGTYSLSGALNFAGTASMDATVSKMVGGWKGFLLKPADRFFKKDGAGTEIPIHVAGTRDAPQFGVDLGPFKTGTHPQRPDQQIPDSGPVQAPAATPQPQR